MVTVANDQPASAFLQSVVMFDDRAYVPPILIVEDPATNVDELAEPMATVVGSSLPQVDWPGDDEFGDLDTEQVVRGFANEGMTCSVLAPNEGDARGDTERFLRLSQRADVVVLDWLILQQAPSTGMDRPASQNRTSLQLVVELLRADRAVGSRLRFVVIYSGIADLDTARAELEKSLSAAFADLSVSSSSGHIDIGDARIVFLPKSSEGTPRPGGLLPYDLGKRVVQEFSDFAAGGLLPELALQSLSAVRDQAHRLLRRFAADMDPALLAHRAMTTPAETEEFVVSLLGDEFATIVANGHVTKLLADEAIDIHVNRRLAGAASAFYWLGRRPEAQARTVDPSLAKRAITAGTNDSYQYVEATQSIKFGRDASLTSLVFSGSEGDVRSRSKQVDLEFAMLSSLSRDGSLDGPETAAPELHIGSILKSETGQQQFFLCLQPLCDSVRLTGYVAFPLLPLTEVGSDVDKFGLVVKDGDFRVLSHHMKMGRIRTAKFLANSNSRTVLAQWNDGWFFRSGRQRFAWLGTVRVDKAHRLVSELTADAGRIGISEYEYLRRRHE